MSAKFKPKKKETEPIVDDWEAADSIEVEDGPPPSSKAASSSIQAAWEEVEKTDEASIPTKVDGRTLWQEANRDAPQAQPLLMNRSLPSTVLSPRLYNSSSSSGDYQHAVSAPPPPQILRREKVQGTITNDKGNEKKKSLKEREEEYKKARERIFGVAKEAASAETQQRTASPSLEGNNSSTKNRNSRTKS